MFHYLMEEYILKDLEVAKKRIEDKPISDEWRGKNHQKLLEPIENITLPMYIVADRNIQGEKILEEKHGGDNKDPERELARKLGGFYHTIFSELFNNSRDFVQGCENRSKIFDLQVYLEKIKEGIIKDLMGQHYETLNEVRTNLEKIWDYESHLLKSRIDFYLSRYPNYTPENIVNRTFPIKNEYQFDGSKLHISEDSKIDLYRRNGTNVVIDIKTGRPTGYHYLTVVGYAMALESSPEEVDKIDIGCIMYVNFSKQDPIPRINCKFYPLYNSLRLEFIDELKEKINWDAQHGELK